MGMFDSDVVKEIALVARALGVEEAALLAVAEIESGGKAFAVVEGRREPLIRFEGHYFDRRLSGAKRDAARKAGLASPTAGAIANPSGQAARWKLLAKAAAIDRKAAYESVSWGLGQVMGAHWAWLGYADIDALVAEARGGAGGQLRLMYRFIQKSGLETALRRRDWETFARGYNGPAFRLKAYHTKLAAAYRRYAGSGAVNLDSAPSATLRHGDRGQAVRLLQAELVRLGYPITVDGVFGQLTRSAVIAFQQAQGLVPDGIVGPRTREHLDRLGAQPPTDRPRDSAPAPTTGSSLSDLLARMVAWWKDG